MRAAGVLPVVAVVVLIVMAGTSGFGEAAIDLAPLLDAGEGVRRGCAPVPTLVGGTGKGRERPREAGRAGWAGQSRSSSQSSFTLAKKPSLSELPSE